MWNTNCKNFIEDLSYLLIIKENPYFVFNNFKEPSHKTIDKIDENLTLNNIYIKKFKLFKEKSYSFWKIIKNYINNIETEELVKHNSIKLLKAIKYNYGYFFKFDYLWVLKIFKIIIYFLIKDVKPSMLTELMILEKWKENDSYSAIEKRFIIAKMIKIVNFN